MAVFLVSLLDLHSRYLSKTMKTYQKIIFTAFSIISLILILNLKSIPSGQLWKNYNILYVPVEADDQVVVNAIDKAGITDSVILRNQYLPTLLSEKTPEIAMYKINCLSEDYSYSAKRNFFFYDKSSKYRLYYLPSEQKNKFSQCINILHSNGITSGIDSTSSYLWFLPVICTILAVCLAVFSVNKFIFGCGVILPVIFVYCNPFYPAAIGNILFQLSLFFASNIWKRKGYLSCLLKNYFLIAMFAIALICPFACTIKSGFIFIVAVAGSLSLIYSYELVMAFVNSKNVFTPVLIRPAKRVSVFANKQKTVMPLICGSAILILALCLISSSSIVNAHFSKIQLPAAKGFPSENLLDLDDYCRWSWNVKTYPYKSINISEDKDTVEYYRFVENDGIVTQTVQTMKYNQDFKNEALEEIDYFAFNSIEKVLKMQNRDVKPGYASTNSYHIGIFGIIISILGLFVLLFLYFSIMIRKGARK